ncbi:hypothetical protein E8E13_001151 [Curvularia kusanoi]|uniref:Xylanolytic transcriptional activator regulatory domain-containing protein n=1 Tax=Curvularia kusanoi TaxID=90978 RepID=A0A9P4T6V6_CURKU|nr:hypothetical protein E8E13_001151 [Curvularia kusanoi]
MDPDLVASGRVFKNPKACEDTPISTQDALAPAINDSASRPPDGGLPRSMPSRLAIFNNIRATQETPQGRTELFYGASSPFSVLQHLDAHLPMRGVPAVYPNPDMEEVQDGDRSIRSYNYQNIVFDHLPVHTPLLSGFDASTYASAKIALRNFLVTASPRLPLDVNSLCADFEKLYGADQNTPLSSADKVLVIAAIAWGALPLADLPHRDIFLTQARVEAANIMYDINTKTVQATLILAQLEFEAGSPNVCYLHLGGAIRKAFAAGVHRSDTPDARQTMWALYCNESLTCFLLGKHYNLTDEDIVFPQPEDSSYAASFVRLCAIARSAHRMYQLEDKGVTADLAFADGVYARLRAFSTELKAESQILIGGPLYALAGEGLAWHITFSYVFYVTQLLLFRPFLLLCLELHRRKVRSILHHHNGGVEIAVLVSAAARCVGAAKEIVNFCDAMFSLQVGIEGTYYHGFHLESACFVLALAAVHHSTEINNGCFEKLHTVLKLLRRLGTNEPVRSVTAAVEQMIERISALTRTPAMSVGETSGAGIQPSAASASVLDAPLEAGIEDALPALDPLQETLTPGWDHSFSLDDLWANMDWNVGFEAANPLFAGGTRM